QVFLDQFADFDLVVDDQDVRGLAHDRRGPIPSSRRLSASVAALSRATRPIWQPPPVRAADKSQHYQGVIFRSAKIASYFWPPAIGCTASRRPDARNTAPGNCPKSSAARSRAVAGWQRPVNTSRQSSSLGSANVVAPHTPFSLPWCRR